MDSSQLLGDEGPVMMFHEILNDVPELLLIEAIQKMEGVDFYYAPRERNMTFTYELVKVQVEAALEWARNPYSKVTREPLAKDLTQMGVQRLAAVQCWTGDLCYPLTSALRKKRRTLRDLQPVLPFAKLFFEGLRGLPERFIKKGTIYRGERGVAGTWNEKMKIGKTIQWFSPLSFSQDPAVLKQFMDSNGNRTLFILEGACGYDIREFSMYQDGDDGEDEVLVECVSQANVVDVECYSDNHVLVKTGQMKSGLHQATLRMISGINMLTSTRSLVEEQLRMSEDVVWEWFTDEKTWEPFSATDAEMLERAHQSGDRTYETRNLSFNQGCLYTFDFDSMCQINHRSRTSRKIRRGGDQVVHGSLAESSERPPTVVQRIIDDFDTDYSYYPFPDFNTQFLPTKSCSEYLLEDAAAVLDGCPQLPLIVRQSNEIVSRVISDWEVPYVTPQELFALVVWTFDLFEVDPRLPYTQNFSYQCNSIIHQRGGRKLWSLAGYLVYLTRGFASLPNQELDVFSGVKAPSMASIEWMSVPGRMLFWRAYSCVTTDFSVASALAESDGIVLKLKIKSGKKLGLLSPLSREDEIFLMPNFRAIVASGIYHHEASGIRILDLMEPDPDRMNTEIF